MKDILDLFRDGHAEFENGMLDHIPESSPYELFQLWMKEAVEAKELEPNAFTLSTVRENKPTSRIVYLKDIIENQYIFYTNYKSKKGSDISENQNVCISFFWPKSSRQVHIQGICTKVKEKISDAYFDSRPKGSQIGAWASNQSQLLNSREELEGRIKELNRKFPDKVDRPEFWGGYQIKANSFEFWQGRKSRLHDRIVFEQHENEWQVHRKNP